MGIPQTGPVWAPRVVRSPKAKRDPGRANLVGRPDTAYRGAVPVVHVGGQRPLPCPTSVGPDPRLRVLEEPLTQRSAVLHPGPRPQRAQSEPKAGTECTGAWAGVGARGWSGPVRAKHQLCTGGGRVGASLQGCLQAAWGPGVSQVWGTCRTPLLLGTAGGLWVR